MAWLIVFAVVLLLGLLPISVHAEYNQEVAAQLLIGPVRLMRYPRNAKKPESNKPGKQKRSGGNFESYETKNKQNSSSLSDLLSVARIVIDFLGDFKRKLIVKDLQLHVLIAGEDPCDVAVNYGRAWAALGNLMPQLERHFLIKKRDLHRIDAVAYEKRIKRKRTSATRSFDTHICNKRRADRGRFSVGYFSDQNGLAHIEISSGIVIEKIPDRFYAKFCKGLGALCTDTLYASYFIV